MPLEMSWTQIALFGLIFWHLVLITVLGGLRTALTVSGQRRANSFSPTGEDVSAFSRRLVRAHANSYEFVPFVLAILLFSIATNNQPVTDPLALVVLGARVCQSFVHIISTSVVAVTLRFALFLPQVAISFYWLIALLQADFS